ncbi:DpnI domain-containing protein [Pseudorhizobium endolithicum]|uniref:DpnI domain-containing protein n=1 Tax=Pseudorhizobium endolithicum TaxID=1191678 RepID=UPI00115938BC|nr:DpnI domain-containing protein [Pseudorhizobium endolithicum]
MVTVRQALGTFGEQRIVQECICPKCKRAKSLVRLPPNFKCADVICDFCGYLAQVKTSSTKNIDRIPKAILGAAWGPQIARMEAAIYFPLYLVLVDPLQQYSIFYLSADLQTVEMFKPRKPLSEKARRAGWQGFVYDMQAVEERLVRLR